MVRENERAFPGCESEQERLDMILDSHYQPLPTDNKTRWKDDDLYRYLWIPKREDDGFDLFSFRCSWVYLPTSSFIPSMRRKASLQHAFSLHSLAFAFVECWAWDVLLIQIMTLLLLVRGCGSWWLLRGTFWGRLGKWCLSYLIFVWEFDSKRYT
jgi:hypothetical protein